MTTLYKSIGILGFLFLSLGVLAVIFGGSILTVLATSSTSQASSKCSEYQTFAADFPSYWKQVEPFQLFKDCRIKIPDSNDSDWSTGNSPCQRLQSLIDNDNDRWREFGDARLHNMWPSCLLIIDRDFKLFQQCKNSKALIGTWPWPTYDQCNEVSKRLKLDWRN